MKNKGIETNKLYLCVYGMFFLKIISDMFYEIQIFDISLTGLSILLLAYVFLQRKIKLNVADVCVLLLAVLFSVSFLKDITWYRDYVKIMSGFVLYFLGRYGLADVDELAGTLGKAYLTAFVVNVVYCLLGFGTIEWAGAQTYNGLYYFKTDFAEMISYFVLFFFTKEKKYNWVDCGLFLIALYFTVMANARIFYLILSLLVVLILLYKKNQKLVSIRNIVVVCAFAVLGLLVTSLIPKIPFFAERNMIGFDFSGELFSTSNFMYRNKIWTVALTAFFDTDMLTQMFGAALSFNANYGLDGITEHSLYVKMLLNTGYVGIVALLVFLVAIAVMVAKDKHRKLGYLCCMLLAVFLVEGISVETIAFTSTTWTTMFFCGLLSSKDAQFTQKEERLEESAETAK